MTSIPNDNSIDSTFSLLSDGYVFISKRCEELQSDIFETRLMLRKAICMTGADAAAMFYQPGRFTRKHATPPNALLLLQDRGSVQTLEGEAHHQRKQMFLSLMRPARIAQLLALFEERWHERLPQWTKRQDVVLHTEVEQLLCSAVCEWAGMPLTEAGVRQRTEEFSAMIDGAGSVGMRNWKGLRLRAHTEVWARSIIQGVRAGHIVVPEESPAQVIAMQRDVDGDPLPLNMAAVELINLLRPTVAVARYITFAALALHQYPECVQEIRAGGEDYLECFVQEVRRFYPFFPLVAGRALHDFDWRGIHFEKGCWVLLDLYGTNHDPRVWQEPDAFRPERFHGWDRSRFNFIPQGGGDFELGHRCAGEWLTIALMKSAVKLLMELEYDVPHQDLRIALSRMPALPESGFVIGRPRPIAQLKWPQSQLQSTAPPLH